MCTLLRAFFCIFLLTFISCHDYGVELRIENSSQFDFDRISVNNVSFGPLKAQKVSNYVPFENVYKSEFIEVVIGNQTLKIVPENFNPEEFYNTGKYKFVVDIVHQKWLSVKFEEE